MDFHWWWTLAPRVRVTSVCFTGTGIGTIGQCFANGFQNCLFWTNSTQQWFLLSTPQKHCSQSHYPPIHFSQSHSSRPNRASAAATVVIWDWSKPEGEDLLCWPKKPAAYRLAKIPWFLGNRQQWGGEEVLEIRQAIPGLILASALLH